MPFIPQYIFGMHDPGAEGIILGAGKTGWTVVTVKVNPPDFNGDFSAIENAGFGVIVRLNNGYNPDGTIPNSAQYDQFAQQCASFVANSRSANIWIIGNETNLAAERPGGDGGQVITPDMYAQCFSKCRAAIKNVPGHASDWLIPAPPAPYNNGTTYPANPSGDWVKYFADILTSSAALGANPDALALHTYTHGLDPNLVVSEQMMGAPFQNRHYHFRAYRDFLTAVPASMRSLPVLITETQAADPDWWQNRNVGWIQAAYAEINAWNSMAANPPIQAVCLFRWQTGNPQWSISDKPALIDDLRGALQFNYRVRLPQAPPPIDPVAAAAVAAAKQRPWMAINTNAALYKFAQAHNLGYPQTDEFQFAVNGDIYIGQVYNLGIVYVKQGDWGNVKSTPKPT